MSMFKKLFLFPIYCYGENVLDQSLGMKMFIKQSNREAAAYQDPDEPLALHDFSFEDYCRLKVKLNLPEGWKVSLSHVDQLWRSLAKEFDLPCLTAVIHSIVMGSLEVTWLILPHIAEEIVTKAKALNSDTFYHDNELVELKIDDVIIYSYNTGEVKKWLEGGTDVNEPNGVSRMVKCC